MLAVEIDEASGVAVLSPSGKLSEADFENVTNLLDPYIEQYGTLKGLIVYTEEFPGWESFSGFLSHLRFIRNHHEKVKSIALVTNSSVGALAEYLASHFISAQVMAFHYKELELAKYWAVLRHDE